MQKQRRSKISEEKEEELISFEKKILWLIVGKRQKSIQIVFFTSEYISVSKQMSFFKQKHKRRAIKKTIVTRNINN